MFNFLRSDCLLGHKMKVLLVMAVVMVTVAACQAFSNQGQPGIASPREHTYVHTYIHKYTYMVKYI